MQKIPHNPKKTLGILEFLSLVSSPDLIGGSHHRDPRVKPEDDIVGNSRIPRGFCVYRLGILEFLKI